MTTRDATPNRRFLKWVVMLLPITIVIVTRILAVPEGIIEMDETNYAMGVVDLNVAKRQPHPPGNPLLVYAGMLVYPIVQDPLLSIRLINLLLSVGAYFAMVALLRLWFERREAIGYALLYSFLPGVWTFSASGLTTPTATSLGLISAALFFSSTRKRTMLIGWVVLGLAAAARPALGLCFLFLGIAALVHWRRRIRTAVLGGFVAVAIAALAMVVVIGVTGWEPYTKHLEMHYNYNAQYDYIELAARRGWRIHPAIEGLGGLAPGIVFTGLFAVGLAGLIRKQPLAAILIGVTATVTAVLLITTTVPTGGRYYSIVFATMLPAVAMGFDTIMPKRLRLAPTILFAVVLAGLMAPQLYQFHRTGEAWTRCMIHARQKAQQEGAGLLIEAGLLRRAGKYHLHDSDVPVLLMFKRPGHRGYRPIYNKDKVPGTNKWYYITSKPLLLSTHAEIFDGPGDARLYQYATSHAAIHEHPVVPGTGVVPHRSKKHGRFYTLKPESKLYTLPGTRRLVLTLDVTPAYQNLIVRIRNDEVLRTDLTPGKREVTVNLPQCRGGCVLDFELVPTTQDVRRPGPVKLLGGAGFEQ